MFFSRTVTTRRLDLKTVEQGAILGGEILLNSGNYEFSARAVSDSAIVKRLDLRGLRSYLVAKGMEDDAERLLNIVRETYSALVEQVQVAGRRGQQQ